LSFEFWVLGFAWAVVVDPLLNRPRPRSLNVGAKNSLKSGNAA
jgi:hypothetical protein